MQWFVVGHDCGHRAFSKNKLVEDIVGTLLFMPLIFPFEPWRIKHNQHHAHTNKCVVVGISDRPTLLPTAPCGIASNANGRLMLLSAGWWRTPRGTRSRRL